MTQHAPEARNTRVGRFRRLTAAATVAVLAVGMAVALPLSAAAAPPVASDGGGFTGVDVSAEASSVLASGVGEIGITASNVAGVDLYNATAVAILPVGVTYVPGSARPGPPNAVGEPLIRTYVPDPAEPTVTAQLLQWANVADLPAGADLDLSFDVVADNDLYPVGASFTVDVGVYANTNERIVPVVTIPTDGTPPVVTRATHGGDDTQTLSISAIRLTKRNLDAEAEVYRGPANATRYRLTVTTADEAGTAGAIVTDLVPAQFQVTDCGLGDVACTTEIVEIDGETFTRLTWDLGDIPADTTVELMYQAFVGLQEITAPDGTADGGPTRPGPAGTSIENTAEVSGTYGGSVVEGGSTQISATAEATVRLLDVGVVKTIATGQFTAGATTRFTLALRTSQYVTTSDVVITDTLADGLCPVVPAGVPTTGAWPAECPAPGSTADTVVGGTMTDVVANADGTFVVTFAVPGDTLAEDAATAIVYSAYMREAYQDGSRTSTGDAVTNQVDVEGTTSPAAGNTVDTGAVESTNDSSASLVTSDLSLSKTVWTNPDREAIAGASGAGVTCATAPAGEYVASDGPRLQLGDLACFRIRIDFTDGASTRNPILTDFLPPGTEFVAWAEGPGNTADAERVTGGARWLLGTPNPDGSRYVPGGGVAVIDILARVTAVPDAGADIDVTGNLAKLRYMSSNNQVLAARDEVDLTLAPTVPLALAKRVNGAGSAAVQEGQSLTFTVGVTHQGSAADGNDYPLSSATVWDALPVGFECADITTSTPASTSCATSTTGPASGRDVVVWNLSGAALGADGLLTAGETVTVTYSLTVPTPLSISSSHTNEAAVTLYTAPTTDGTPDSAGDVTFYPENDLGANPGITPNAPEASDTATVTLADATVAKQVAATGVNGPGNSALTQATIGESVDYTYTVTIPARTSVFSGILDDGLPTGGRLVQTGDPTLTTAPGGITVGAGCTADAAEFRLCDDGTLRFPTTWTNASATAAVFTVTLPTRVADVAGNVNAAPIPNTATFRSAPTVNGSLVQRGTASASVSVVEPSVTLAKTSSATNVAGGSAVNYTLTATNAAGRSPLFDGVVVDCVPAALAVGTLPGAIAGPVAGNGSNGCAVGTQRLTWTLSAPLLAGTPQSIQYPVTVPSGAASGQQYTNNATLTGSSMPGAVTGERSYSTAASRTITVNRASLVKTASSATVVPGQSITWTVTATVPANVQLFNAAFVDVIPAAFGNAAAVTSWSLSCGGGDATWRDDCLTGTLLTASPASNFGVYLGSIAPATASRTVTLALTTRLPANTTSVQGANLNNTAQFRWNYAEQTPPTATNATWSTNVSGSASTQVREPQVTVTKAVSNAQPAQGEVFTYTVTAAATADVRNVPAFNVAIVDTVPAGVVPLDAAGDPVADGDSTASGGVWSSTARTLTWTVATLAPGAANTVTRTYPARLAPSSSLTGTALTNSVRPQSWTSLASDGKTYGPGTAATAAVTPQFPLIATAKTQVTPANPVYIGQEVSFRLELTNSGGGTAASLDAVDTLPAGWTYVADSAAVTVRTGSAVAVDPTITGQTLRWSDVGGTTVDLLTNERIVVTYRAVAGPSVQVGLSVPHTNTAVAADVTDATGGTSYNGGSGSYIGASGSATARIASADLRITKTANNDFIAGGSGTYTLTVTNAGPDAAAGVTVVDAVTAPAGVTVIGAAGAGWSCSAPSDGSISCTRTNAADTLASGASWTLTVTAAVAASVLDGTQIPNTATVSARTEDRNPDNNSASATATVRARADLAVTKTPTRTTATAGTALGWTISLVNRGPSVSRGSAGSPIVLTDTLPAGVTGVEVGTVTDDVDCEIAAGVLTCEVPFDLAVGDGISVSLDGTIVSSAAPGSTIANTARVTPVTTDPVAGNNSSTASTTVDIVEALSVSKSIIAPQPPVVVPGQTLTYRIAVTNAGPSDARGVTVLDDLPAGLTFSSIVAGGSSWTATAQGGDILFTLSGNLAAGASSQFDFVATVGAGVIGELTNTAAVSSTWRANQDTASVTTGSTASSDLAITKSVDAASIVAGGDTAATYTLSVANLGPSDAVGSITVTDLLPTGMTLVGTPPAGCEVTEVSGRVRVQCDKADGLDVAEDPWTIELPVLVDADVTDAALTNSATVTSPTPDPDLTNNTDTAVLPVVQHAALAVTKDAAPTVVAGENATWTVTVTNNGPSDAQAVTLTDDIDDRLTLVSAASEADGVDCSGTTQVVCTIGILAAGDSVVIEVVTTVASSVPDGTIIPNTAVAHSTTIDAATDEPATAEGEDSVEVSAVTALTLVKEAVEDVVDAGDVASFTLSLVNDGPSDAADPVTIVDTLPAGMTYLGASTSGGPGTWDCDIDGQVLTCELTDDGDVVTLAAGATAPPLAVSATIGAGESAGTLTNTAVASSPSSPDGAEDEASVTVVTHADLELVKSHDPSASATAGLPFEWTIAVTNHGPSDSVATSDDPIVVRDTLPEGVTLADAPVSGGADTVCAIVDPDADPQVVECARTTTLPAGETLELTLSVDIDESASGALTNTATVFPGLTPQTDDNTWPDTDTDTITVIEVADLSIEKETVTAPVVAGGAIVWTLTVRNLGPSDSDASPEAPITVVDTLPAGVTGASASGEGWDCAPIDLTDDGREQVECTRDTTLLVGAAPVITVTGVVSSSVQGSITNTAAVTPGLTQNDGDGPSEASVTDEVGESADLALTKTIARTITAGGTGEYRLSIVNLGPSDARGVVLTDTLPAGLSYAGIAASTDGFTWSCEPDEIEPTTVVCELAEPIPAGQTVVLDVTVDAESQLEGDLENTAVVSADTPDPDLENNSSSVSGTVSELADLAIVKQAVGEPHVGEQFSYTLTVTNGGPSDARGIVIEDAVPAQLTVDAIDAGDWTCASIPAEGAPTDVTCLLPQLVSGGTAPVITITVTVLPAAYPAVSNTATVTAATPEDPETLADNTSTVTSTVPALSSLSITKDLTSTLYAGFTGAYTITVTNEGPTADPGPITVTDDLPAGLTYRSATVDGVATTCDVAGREVTCTVGPLEVGESTVLVLTVNVAADASGSLQNTATVSSEADPESPSSTATGTVDRSLLAATGTALGLLPASAVLLLLLGLLLVRRARRREIVEP
ncbi:DUF11 domain-containing protein [Microbacterium sp. SSM24]|uniref:DUF11 domain-containing protein n=1 Tax=Microbacterium sp. SSM24 TaxID=2991714 RepID=UPI0022270D17|nr:DUF11 domain-containing protein [Microbacterium sp. SSM24]MCW3492275.1 DUF11 domain-containing protein [Microbacterium sp. SSM24]